MKDTSNIRPEGVQIEQLEGGKARVSLCINIVEEQNADGNAVFTYDRYSIDTIWAENLEARVTGALQAWIDKLKDAEDAQEAARVRAIRNQLLTESDSAMAIDRALQLDIPERITTTTMLTVLKDLFEAFSNVFNGAWVVYRQRLRDLPQQAGFPWNVEWPTKPE